MAEKINRKVPLCDRVGNARIEHDFSLDFASFLSCHADVKGTESTEKGIRYNLNEGSVELKREITAIGKVVVFFNDCPKEIYNALIYLQEKTVQKVNKLYPIVYG